MFKEEELAAAVQDGLEWREPEVRAINWMIPERFWEQTTQVCPRGDGEAWTPIGHSTSDSSCPRHVVSWGPAHGSRDMASVPPHVGAGCWNSLRWAPSLPSDLSSLGVGGAPLSNLTQRTRPATQALTALRVPWLSRLPACFLPRASGLCLLYPLGYPRAQDGAWPNSDSVYGMHQLAQETFHKQGC